MASLKRFNNKVMVITGGGGGLGQQLSVDFAKRGWKVCVSDVDLARARETVQLVDQNGGKGIAFQCDVTKIDDIQKTADTVLNKWGSVDIIINNAGVPVGGLIKNVPMDDWRWIMNINLMGTIHGCKVFTPIFESQGGGHIVNIASIAGIVSLAGQGPYSASKAAIISLSETLKIELAAKKIGVTVACPSYFLTDFLKNLRYSDEHMKKMSEAFYKKCKSTPEGVSKCVIKAVEKNSLYAFPYFDAKFYYKFKRLAPETYFKLSGFLYGKGILDKMLGMNVE